jgi:hypothetical protein
MKYNIWKRWIIYASGEGVVLNRAVTSVSSSQKVVPATLLITNKAGLIRRRSTRR